MRHPIAWQATRPPSGGWDRRQNAVRWLRLSYRTGALVDLAAAVGMAYPGRLWPLRFAPPLQRDRAELAYGMRAGAPLMAGWAVLLVWADRQPMQRKGVLPITMAPVLVGLLANDALAVRAGQVAPASVLPTRTLQVALLVLFGCSYTTARRAQAHGQPHGQACG